MVKASSTICGATWVAFCGSPSVSSLQLDLASGIGRIVRVDGHLHTVLDVDAQGGVGAGQGAGHRQRHRRAGVLAVTGRVDRGGSGGGLTSAPFWSIGICSTILRSLASAVLPPPPLDCDCWQPATPNANRAAETENHRTSHCATAHYPPPGKVFTKAPTESWPAPTLREERIANRRRNRVVLAQACRRVERQAGQRQRSARSMRTRTARRKRSVNAPRRLRRAVYGDVGGTLGGGISVRGPPRPLRFMVVRQSIAAPLDLNASQFRHALPGGRWRVRPACGSRDGRRQRGDLLLQRGISLNRVTASSMAGSDR